MGTARQTSEFQFVQVEATEFQSTRQYHGEKNIKVLWQFKELNVEVAHHLTRYQSIIFIVNSEKFPDEKRLIKLLRFYCWYLNWVEFQ
jgi:hypothetical protein